MNDDAVNEETTDEAGGRHRGHLVLRTVNEDEDFIAIHNDLVEHYKDDDMDENKKIKRNQEEVKAHPRKPRRNFAVVIARESGDEHSDRITAKLEAYRIKGEGHHARYHHLVAEAGSVV